MEKKVIKKTTIKKDTTKKVAPKVAATPVVSKVEYKSCRFTDKNLKVSPRKLRLMANDIKKYSPLIALTKLSLTNTNSARILHKALETAISVAKNNYNLLADSLKFETILVDEGQKIKRMDKAHGSRFARGIITKRHSRLIINIKGQVK